MLSRSSKAGSLFRALVYPIAIQLFSTSFAADKRPEVAEISFAVDKSVVARMAGESTALGTFAASLTNAGKAMRFSGNGGAMLYLPASNEILVQEFDEFSRTGSFSKYSKDIVRYRYQSNFARDIPEFELKLKLDDRRTDAQSATESSYRLVLTRIPGTETFRIASWAIDTPSNL